MLFILKKWLGHLLMPLPFALALLLVALLLLTFTRWQRVGRTLVLLGILVLGLFGSRPISDQLAHPLEQQYPAFAITDQPLDAIVVLGNGHVSDPKLPLTSWPNNIALARVLEGVRLAKAYPNAQLFLSGAVSGDRFSNAEVNARVAESLGVERVRMRLYQDNLDTHDEAVSMAQALKGKRVALVTSATHMPRALALYRKVGLEPIPAPTDYTAKTPTEAQPSYSYLPRGRYLMYSEAALHEWIGQLWSRLRGQVE